MDLRERVVTHLRSGQVSKVVYGSIIGLALVLTLEAHPPGVGTAIGTLVASGVAVALAELYSEWVGGRARASLGGPREPLAAVVEDTVAVGFGVAFPSVFFILAVVTPIDYDTAFALAKWTGLGLIAGYGYVAARLSGTTRSAAFVEATVVGVIAATLIVVKALLH
jgi:hypothetical protein